MVGWIKNWTYAGVWLIQTSAVPQKPESPSDSLRDAILCITAAVSLSLSLTHTHPHTPVTVIYCTLIYTLTNHHLSYLRYACSNIRWHTHFHLQTVYCTSQFLLCTLNGHSQKIYCFALLQNPGLYLAVFIDSGLTHYTVLFSISQIRCKSPDTPHKKEKERERARERERQREMNFFTKQHSLIDSICNRKEIAAREMYFFYFCLFPSLFHMIITSMCQSDIFVNWNALSWAGVAEIYGLDQKAVCDRNLWIYGYVIVPRHHTTAIYCLINKGMVNIITGANIACILETDIFTAYQYGPHHAWYYLTSGLSNLGPELSCFMFHTGHILYPGLVIYLGQSGFKISSCSFKKQSCNFKNVVFYSAKEKKSKMTVKTFIL